MPKGTISSDAAHAGDAPLVAALVGLLALAAVGLEVRRGTMNGSTVALLGVLAASAGMLKLLDLPGGGNGMFFLIVLGGAAFGPRFGFLLGLAAYAVGAVITGGLGPWLPFQMLTLAWMGAGAGWPGGSPAGSRPLLEVVLLAGVRLGLGLRVRRGHEPVVLALVRGRGRAGLAPRARARRHARALLVLLRGHLAGVGRRRRARRTPSSSSWWAGPCCARCGASPTASTRWWSWSRQDRHARHQRR